jgi:hypothetical protein
LAAATFGGSNIQQRQVGNNIWQQHWQEQQKQSATYGGNIRRRNRSATAVSNSRQQQLSATAVGNSSWQQQLAANSSWQQQSAANSSRQPTAVGNSGLQQQAATAGGGVAVGEVVSDIWRRCCI